MKKDVQESLRYPLATRAYSNMIKYNQRQKLLFFWGVNAKTFVNVHSSGGHCPVSTPVYTHFIICLFDWLSGKLLNTLILSHLSFLLTHVYTNHKGGAGESAPGILATCGQTKQFVNTQRVEGMSTGTLWALILDDS